MPPITVRKIVKPEGQQVLRWDGDNKEEVIDFLGSANCRFQTGTSLDEGAPIGERLYVHNALTGQQLEVPLGDFIAKGAQEGDIYPIASSVIDEEFEVVEG
jgi:hypothetical protein